MLEPHPTSASSTLTPSIPCLKDAFREGSVQCEPPRTYVKSTLQKSIYLLSLCEDVGREGSMRFDVLEPPRSGALLHPAHL